MILVRPVVPSSVVIEHADCVLPRAIDVIGQRGFDTPIPLAAVGFDGVQLAHCRRDFERLPADDLVLAIEHVR